MVDRFCQPFSSNTSSSKGRYAHVGSLCFWAQVNKLCAKHPNEIPEQHREAILEFAGLDRTVAGSSIASNTRAATAFLEPMTR